MVVRALLACIRTSTIHHQQLLKNIVPSCIMSSEHVRWVNQYAGPECSIEDISQQFNSLEGGKVDLLKDEESGIATIHINHPERRNALSGKNGHHTVNITNEVLSNSNLRYAKPPIILKIHQVFIVA